MVTTFQNLCKLADFENLLCDRPPETTKATENATDHTAPIIHRSIGVTPEIRINIQLVLPETSDTSIYDDLFKSLKTHLLSDEG
jgi:hypothetical protein